MNCLVRVEPVLSAIPVIQAPAGHALLSLLVMNAEIRRPLGPTQHEIARCHDNSAPLVCGRPTKPGLGGVDDDSCRERESRSVNTNRDPVDDRERLRMFREHGRKRAGDNVKNGLAALGSILSLTNQQFGGTDQRGIDTDGRQRAYVHSEEPMSSQLARDLERSKRPEFLITATFVWARRFSPVSDFFCMEPRISAADS